MSYCGNLVRWAIRACETAVGVRPDSCSGPPSALTIKASLSKGVNATFHTSEWASAAGLGGRGGIGANPPATPCCSRGGKDGAGSPTPPEAAAVKLARCSCNVPPLPGVAPVPPTNPRGEMLCLSGREIGAPGKDDKPILQSDAGQTLAMYASKRNLHVTIALSC